MLPELPPAIDVSLEEVLDWIGDGLVMFDRQWRYTFVNRAAEAYLGRPRDELLGNILWELYPEAIGSEVERAYRAAIAGAEPVELEVLTPVRNRWVAQRLYPTPAGLTVSFRDITELKLASDALKLSEARWRAVFENSLEGVALTEPDGTILAMNPAGCRMLGRSEAEVRAIGRAGVVDADDVRVHALVEERARRGRAAGEVLMRRADGSRFVAEVASAAFRDAAGETLTSLSFRDLTEQKRAEEARRTLADAGVQLQASLDVATTLENLARLVVPRLADACLVDLVDETGIRREVAHHRDPGLGDAMRALREPAPDPARERPITLAKVVRTRQGELIPVVTHEWLGQAARNPTHLAALRAIAPTSMILVPLVARDAVIGVLTLMAGPSGRRFDEQDLALAHNLADRAAFAIDNARLYAVAVDARRQRDEVLAAVSHDLRSPLNAIALYAQLLARRAPSRQLDGIRLAAARADHLVQDLLTIATIDAGALPLYRAAEDVTAIVDEVAMLHRALAEERGVGLRTEIDADLCQTDLDRHRIVQALSNLVGNALKFTPKGGTVTIVARGAAGALVLEVSDTGPGIPADQLPHLFDRFWRGGTGDRRGVGLGLAITKGIVDAHGGTIDVQTAVGGGTRFVLSVPVPREAQHARSA